MITENYAGHHQHCECIVIAKSSEREYARIAKLNDKLYRVARACEKHQCVQPCFICVTLRELNESQKNV